MEKHFVTFNSPGTIFAEQTTLPIESWDTDKATEMARGVRERYGATPYGFFFTTRARGEEDLDSKVVATSCFYFLGGKVYTVEELERLENPKYDTLIRNMRCNGWKRVVMNSNSWLWTQPLGEEDVVLKFSVESISVQQERV